jgi:hypothetical protein
MSVVTLVAYYSECVNNNFLMLIFVVWERNYSLIKYIHLYSLGKSNIFQYVKYIFHRM